MEVEAVLGLLRDHGVLVLDRSSECVQVEVQTDRRKRDKLSLNSPSCGSCSRR
jgi:hypothetical protein